MCPTAISMNTYVLRIHILTDIVNLCGKSVLTRHPDTGLAQGQTCQSGIWTLLGSYTFSFETLVPSTGQLIRPVSTHVCYPSGWLKHPNSRKGEFFLKVLNGWWVVTSHNGRRLEITCAQYRN